MTPGINTLSGLDITRRNRIILAFALGIGLGVVQQPNFLEGGGGAIFSGSIMQSACPRFGNEGALDLVMRLDHEESVPQIW